MPRVDDPKAYLEKKAREEELEENKPDRRFLYKKIYGFSMAGLYLAASLTCLLAPLFTIEGGYGALVSSLSVLPWYVILFGFLFVAYYLFIAGRFLLSSLVKFEEGEKKSFFSYVFASGGGLVFTILLGASENVPAMILSISLAGFSLLFLYLDFKLFWDL